MVGNVFSLTVAEWEWIGFVVIFSKPGTLVSAHQPIQWQNCGVCGSNKSQPSPRHHHFYLVGIFYHSQSRMVYGVVLLTLFRIIPIETSCSEDFRFEFSQWNHHSPCKSHVSTTSITIHHTILVPCHKPTIRRPEFQVSRDLPISSGVRLVMLQRKDWRWIEMYIYCI